MESASRYKYVPESRPCYVLGVKSEAIEQYADEIKGNSDVIYQNCKTVTQIFDVLSSGPMSLKDASPHCLAISELSADTLRRCNVIEGLFAAVLPIYGEVENLATNLPFPCEYVSERAYNVLQLGKAISEYSVSVTEHFVALLEISAPVLAHFEVKPEDASSIIRCCKTISANTDIISRLCKAVAPPSETVN